MSIEPWKGQRIGNLRERITFQGDAEIIGENEYNEPIYGDPVEIEVWARSEPIKGTELTAAAQTASYHEQTFYVRHRDDLKATWTIDWRGRTYNITAWQNADERRRYLAIQAKATT